MIDCGARTLGIVTTLATLVVVWTPAAPAQSEQIQPPTLELMRHVDNNTGFELQIPAGWQYDRTGYFGPGGSQGVLRGSTLRGRATLQILMFHDVDGASFPDWIDAFANTIGRIGGVLRVAVSADDASKRPAAFVIVDSQLGGDRVQTLYYCVQFDDATIWVLSYASTDVTASDMPAATSTQPGDVHVPEAFAQIAHTLRVFYDPELAAKLDEGLRRGRDYLLRFQLQEDIRKLRVDDKVRYYLIQVGGKPIGYMTRQFNREWHGLDDPRFGSEGKEGVRVRERSWRFGDDGSARYTSVDLFSSVDGGSDLFEITSGAVLPDPAGGKQTRVTRDECVRQDDVLFSSFTTSEDVVMPDPRSPLKLENTYLGLAWVRLLPALLGTEEGPLRAFTIYDTTTRTILTYSIRPLGKRALPGEVETQAYAYETRDGFSDSPGMFYADENGQMLRFEAEGLVIRQTNEALVDKLFGKQRDEASKQFSTDSD